MTTEEIRDRIADLENRGIFEMSEEDEVELVQLKSLVAHQ